MGRKFILFLDSIDMPSALIFGLGLGLAPFVPEPHVVEKLRMLFDGTLSRPLDIFDLVMHGSGVVVLTAKLIREAVKRR